MTLLIAASPASTTGGFSAIGVALVAENVALLTALSWWLFVLYDRRAERREQQREKGERHA